MIEAPPDESRKADAERRAVAERTLRRARDFVTGAIPRTAEGLALNLRWAVADTATQWIQAREFPTKCIEDAALLARLCVKAAAVAERLETDALPENMVRRGKLGAETEGR